MLHLLAAGRGMGEGAHRAAAAEFSRYFRIAAMATRSFRESKGRPRPKGEAHPAAAVPWRVPWRCPGSALGWRVYTVESQKASPRRRSWHIYALGALGRAGTTGGDQRPPGDRQGTAREPPGDRGDSHGNSGAPPRSPRCAPGRQSNSDPRCWPSPSPWPSSGQASQAVQERRAPRRRASLLHNLPFFLLHFAMSFDAGTKRYID